MTVVSHARSRYIDGYVTLSCVHSVIVILTCLLITIPSCTKECSRTTKAVLYHLPERSTKSSSPRSARSPTGCKTLLRTQVMRLSTTTCEVFLASAYSPRALFRKTATHYPHHLFICRNDIRDLEPNKVASEISALTAVDLMT